MPLTLTLPDGYGYVAIIALGVIPVVAFAHGIAVGQARKAAGIPYPNAYATAEQAKNSKAAYRFNCAQRAHGQLLENMSQTIMSMLFAGAFYPQATIWLSTIWTVFRLVYMYGYIYSDKPNGRGRMNGVLYYIGQVGLWGLCISGGLQLI